MNFIFAFIHKGCFLVNKVSQLLPIAITRYHDQSNLQKKAFDWWFADIFRELVHGYHERKHGSRQALHWGSVKILCPEHCDI